MDLIVRQATEAGVQRVIPVHSRYSQTRFAGKREMEKKLERWRRIARQAVQQSGAVRPPLIEAPRRFESSLQEISEAKDDEARLFFHQDRKNSDTLHRCLSKSVKIITLVVGPEGGLDQEEVDLLRKMSFVPITVGHTVLRTETAALYAIAAVQTVINERSAWAPT
jgi:16S rRNA (uracil1498-N3)-methyltransferase